MKTGSEIKECEQNPALCSSCTVTASGACNTYIYPEDRRKCIHCTPSEGKDCTLAAQLNSKYCSQFDDNCVAVGKDGKVKLGCETDLTQEERERCLSGELTCSKCDSNDCNKGNMVSCYTCSGDKCQRTSHRDDVKLCNADDVCVAIFDNCKKTFLLVSDGTR